MRLIYTDNQRIDVGFLTGAEYSQEDSADNNLITVKMAQQLSGKLSNGCYIYCDSDAEIGGRINRYDSIDTAAQTVTFGGYSWRGILGTRIVCPPIGQSYKKYVYADALTTSDIATQLISGCDMNDLFVAEPTEDIGREIQFDRYCTLLSALEKLYRSAGCRLKLEYQPDIGKIHVSGAATQSTANIDSLNTDFVVSVNQLPITHLICLGSGELSERTVVHLYLQQNGSISTSQYYTGTAINEKVYDYPNAESTEQLTAEGMKIFEELLSATTSMSAALNDNNATLYIGDAVSGRESISGLTVNQYITRKITNISIGAFSADTEKTTSYETGELLQ